MPSIMKMVLKFISYCSFIHRVDGLFAIVITDRDGVPLVKGL